MRSRHYVLSNITVSSGPNKSLLSAFDCAGVGHKSAETAGMSIHITYTVSAPSVPRHFNQRATKKGEKPLSLGTYAYE